MKCYCCGKEMEQGVIQSAQEINWQSKKRLLNNSDLYDDAVCLSRRSFWKGSAVEAWLCRNCRKVVIDYADPDSDFNQKHSAER